MKKRIWRGQAEFYLYMTGACPQQLPVFLTSTVGLPNRSTQMGDGKGGDRGREGGRWVCMHVYMYVYNVCVHPNTHTLKTNQINKSFLPINLLNWEVFFFKIEMRNKL